MDILNTFLLGGTTHEIAMIMKDDKPLFRASDVGKVLGLKNVSQSISCFHAHEKVLISTDTHGGPQDVMYLTESATYRLINRSRKPIAEPFQRWVSDVLISIREKGKYELEQRLADANAKLAEADAKVQTIEQSLQAEAERANNASIIALHNTLVDKYCGPERYLVYFGFIRNIGDKKLIKIGTTKDLSKRVPQLAKEFGSMYIFDVFECSQSYQFEKFLHTHKSIAPFAYNEVIHNDHKSNSEVFMMTQDEIDQTTRIAKVNVQKFISDPSIIKTTIELEIEKLRLERAKLENGSQHQSNIAYENMYIPFDVGERQYTQVRGNKIQRYSKDGKELLETYIGCAEVSRDPELDSPVQNMIMIACDTNVVYKGYRWARLERSLPDDTFQDIGETSENACQRHGYVAMINLNKTEIMNVFCDQKAAAEDRQFKGIGAISSAIKKGTKSGGFYFSMWYDCSEDLKSKYLETNALPMPRILVNGKPVEKLHPITKDVVQKFASTAHVIKTMRIARASLNKAIEHKYILKGYYWRFMEITNDTL